MGYNIIAHETLIVSSPQFDLRCGFSCTVGGKDLPTTKHYDHIEMYYVLDGMCTLEVEGKQSVIKKGNLAIIPCNSSHRILNLSDDFKRVIIGLYKLNKNSNSICNIITEKTKEQTVYNDSENFKHCIEFILDYAANEYKNYITALQYMFVPLLYELLNIMNIEIGYSYKNIKIENNKRISEIKNYIEKNLSRKLTAQMVASHFNLSLRQLNRITTDSVGWNVKMQIDSTKYNEAKQLLLNTNLNMLEISARLGFSSEHSFIVFFKRMASVTPFHYKKNYEELINHGNQFIDEESYKLIYSEKEKKYLLYRKCGKKV